MLVDIEKSLRCGRLEGQDGQEFLVVKGHLWSRCLGGFQGSRNVLGGAEGCRGDAGLRPRWALLRKGSGRDVQPHPDLSWDHCKDQPFLGHAQG